MMITCGLQLTRGQCGLVVNTLDKTTVSRQDDNLWLTTSSGQLISGGALSPAQDDNPGLNNLPEGSLSVVGP